MKDKTSSKPANVAKASPRKQAAPKSPSANAGEPVLLSGGNPQIAKGYGDGPVQAYLAAVPGWKQDVARRLDALITEAVPDVRKAVKWNSPLYGVEEGTWFLSFHVFAKYLKIAFFRGASLVPLPPVESRQKEVRYFHLHEGDELDEAHFIDWVQQASQLPGERM
ncbi:MAG TPA: DUF1801 domain-containing protein [Pirellulaceae bacterium]|jgi:hypothetical protein|nr:DUF1801 domain-containing protein [Pirellulaceae bacterium]